MVTTLVRPGDYWIFVHYLKTMGAARGVGGGDRSVIVPNDAYVNALKTGSLGADVARCQSVGAR